MQSTASRRSAVETVTSQLERSIKSKYPEVRRLYIETQSSAGHHAAALEAARLCRRVERG